MHTSRPPNRRAYFRKQCAGEANPDDKKGEAEKDVHPSLPGGGGGRSAKEGAPGRRSIVSQGTSMSRAIPLPLLEKGERATRGSRALSSSSSNESSQLNSTQLNSAQLN
eukprot:CAMPEP_0113597946 /NCGR_PEP_ID=MMETSP0015_2-20120614/41296_1 /TAXON_ID=2838 /ORGANISM="Odontella" /LENGTH=108 /DNA_ID=CAMNT_0000505873 /DNA_START=664 /DNA_END=987 /DNA_ORIENTATION=- /assembly_acc=CAM_ASM_000160